MSSFVDLRKEFNHLISDDELHALLEFYQQGYSHKDLLDAARATHNGTYADAVWHAIPSTFTPERDLPSVIAHYDASKLPGAVGSVPLVVLDQSANGARLTPVNNPTVAAGPNGLKVLDLGATGYLFRNTFGAGDHMAPAGYALPITLISVFKAPAAVPDAVNPRYPIQGTSVYLGSANLTGSLYGNAGTVAQGGPSILDGQWHIGVAVLTVNGSAVYLDGYHVAGLTATAGAGTLVKLALGASASAGPGNNALGGQWAESIICNAALTPAQINAAVAALAAKWGITPAKPQIPVTFQDTTSPNGQSVRIWEPRNLIAGAPLILYSHNSGGTQQVTPSAATWFYPLIMAACAMGWRVAASNQHANSWGDQNALDDNFDLFSMMNARQAVPKVVMVGSSMGGISALLAVPEGRIPVVGVALQDPVTNLADVYAPQAGFTNFSAAINTAYGVASYAAIPAGFDPQTRSAGDFTAVRYRIYQSTTDATNVNPANNGNLFAVKIATAPEAGIVTHYGGHLAADVANPADFVAFCQRCGLT